MTRPFAALATVLAALGGPVALAASGPQLSPEQLAHRADRVVVAEVANVRTEGEGAQLRTVTALSVRESWKGEGPALLEVVQLGGAAGGYQLQVAGDARFSPGEQVVAFLRCREAAGARCTLIGLAQGRVKLQRTADGEVEVELRDGGAVRRVALGQLRQRLARTPPGDGQEIPRTLVPAPAPGGAKVPSPQGRGK